MENQNWDVSQPEKKGLKKKKKKKHSKELETKAYVSFSKKIPSFFQSIFGQFLGVLRNWQDLNRRHCH